VIGALRLSGVSFDKANPTVVTIGTAFRHYSGGVSMMSWNDEPHRTKEDVLAMLMLMGTYLKSRGE